MPLIGRYNTLTVRRIEAIGLFLDGGEYGDILLPIRYAPKGAVVGQSVEVFLYHDSEDRLIATTLKPAAQVGEFAFLRVATLTKIGAFLEWGLPKDLFVPFREQSVPMRPQQAYLVRVYLDPLSGRIAASTRLEKFLSSESQGLTEGEEVQLWVAKKTELGFKVIVNNRFWGLLYHNEVFQPLSVGRSLPGYIRQIRPNGNLDIRLSPSGYQELVPEASEQLLSRLREAGGFLPLTDDSPPEEIYKVLQMSKKTFKKALGYLYKQQKVRLEENGIRLVTLSA